MGEGTFNLLILHDGEEIRGMQQNPGSAVQCDLVRMNNLDPKERARNHECCWDLIPSVLQTVRFFLGWRNSKSRTMMPFCGDDT